MGIIAKLFATRDYLVGVALLAFSVLLPIGKLVLGGNVAIGTPGLDARHRERILYLLATAGKWSMADVFVVGLMIVFFKAEGFQFTFHAGAGLYCYAAAALTSSAVVSLAKRACPPPRR